MLFCDTCTLLSNVKDIFLCAESIHPEKHTNECQSYFLSWDKIKNQPASLQFAVV